MGPPEGRPPQGEPSLARGAEAASWDGRALELADWLRVIEAWGGGLLTLRVAGAEGHVLCHVTRSLVAGEAAGNVALGDGGWLGDQDVDRLVSLGWLPPGAESSRWQRRWARDDPREAVAAELLAVLRSVYRAAPSELVVEVGRCGDAACVVHADVTGGRSGARPPLRRR